MAGFVVRDHSSRARWSPAGDRRGARRRRPGGAVNGIGVGVFRVHPLIMTLGMSLVVLGLANVWQLQTVQTGTGVPPGIRSLGSQLLGEIAPYSLVVFLPVVGLDPAGTPAHRVRPTPLRDR